MKLILSATVASGYGSKTVRCQSVTHVVIWAGKQRIATGSLGGKYSKSQALLEFHRNHKRFVSVNGDDLTVLAQAVST